MQEKWVNIKAHPGYQVSNLGRVRSCNRFIMRKLNRRLIRQSIKGVILSPNDNGKGYLTVQLGRGQRQYIHRLVAEHFLDNPNKYSEINHKNANKQDNIVYNLEWCDRQGNIDHSVALGLNLKGERSPNALLNEQNVRMIKSMISKGTKQVDIAKMFGVSCKCISDINVRSTWKHVV